MSKKKAIITLCIVSVVVALSLIFSFISFDVAGKNYKYMGFANAVQQGVEYGGGVYADYEAIKPEGMSDADYASELDETFARVESVLSTKGMDSAYVAKTQNGIRVEVPNRNDASDVLSALGAGLLKIRTADDATADPIITGEDVVAAFATQLQTSQTAYQWGAYISFNDEGKDALATATKDAENSAITLYMYRGEEETAFFSLQIQSKVADGFMFISSSSMSQEYAEGLALQLYSGSLPLTIETVGDQVLTVSAGIGKTAILGLAIAAGALILALVIFFVVRYREFGLMITLSLLLFVGLMLFLLQAMPIYEISVAGMAGVLVSILLFATSHIVIFERIKREYASGKKIPAAVKFAFKRSTGLIIDASALLMIAGILCYFIGTGALKTFAIALLVGSALSLLISVLITKFLTDSYVAFNKTNAKRVNLRREEGIDEIG